MTVDVSTLAVEVRSTGVKETADGLNKVFIEAGKAERRVKTLTDSIDKLSNVFSKGSAAAMAYQDAVAKANRQVGGHNEAALGLTKAMTMLSATIGTLNVKMDALDVTTRKSTTAMMGHTAAMKDAHAMARGLAGSLGALWVTYGSFAPMAAGIAIGASFKAIVTAGAGVQNTMEGIRVKGEESMDSIAQMTAAVRDLGKGVYGPQEVAKAFETLILAGLSAKQAMVGIKDAMNLAVVGGTSIEKAAYTQVQVATSLGYTAAGFGRVGDVIAKTAAVSMSSVESLSEAFKSASAVGKLYGASLVDIGTGLAALSQLGIQGSAAGTSLKNFYKELASSSDKLKGTLASMKMVPADLKDANGDFLDMVTVVGKLSAGLDKLSPAQQKLAMDAMANERGLKTLVEVLDMYRKKTGETANALQDFRDKIADSYAFTALGAAQLALTTENQFKSMKNTLMTSFVKAFEGINDPLLVITSRLREAFGSPEFVRAIQGIAVALAELALTVVENADKIGGLVLAIMAFKSVMWVVGMIKGLVIGLEAFQTALMASRLAVMGLYASLGLIGVALGIAAAAWAYYNSQKDAAGSEKQKAALNTLDEYVKSLDKETDRMEEVNRLMLAGKTLRQAETQAIEDGAIALARSNKLKAEEAAADRVRSAQKEYDDAKPNAWQIGGEQTYGRVKAKAELDAANANLKSVQTQTAAAMAGVEIAIQRARAAARAQAVTQEAQAEAEREKARAGAGTGTIPGKDDKSAAKHLAAELLSLDKLTASYKARTKAMQEADEAGLKVMAGVHQAQVQAEIDDGKLTAAAGAKLMVHAKAADAAKFEMDGMTALSDLSQKIARQHEIEVAGLAEANLGHTKLTGALEAEALQMLKLWSVAPDGAYARRLLAEARATDEATAAKERALKFNKGTEEVKQEAASHFQAGDALRDYGKAGKQTAIELARLKVVQEGINPVTQANIVSDRLAAAGLLDMGIAYENLYKITNTLKDANDKADADQIDSVLTNEQAKVMVKREATLKAIEFSTQQAEAARNLAILEGKYGDEQIAAFQKVMDARTTAMSQLETSTKNGLQAARSKDLASMIEESKALGSTLEASFGGAGKAIGGMVTAMAELQKAQEDYNNTLSLAAKERAKGNNVKALALEEEATKKSARAQVKNYADMIGASKNFFKEGSTGYKLLGAAEKAFRAAEMAMAYEAMIRKIFFTEAVTKEKVVGDQEMMASAVMSSEVETQAAFAVSMANAGVAVTNQGGGDPYTAFFRIAAMAAIMAGLGFGVGGGGGGASVPTSEARQKAQGTGTVLGDDAAKSESIAHAIEIFAKNSDISLKYTSDMLRTLKSIDSGIAGMASAVARASGLRGTRLDEIAAGVGSSRGFLGFNSSKTTLMDQGIDLGTHAIGDIRDHGGITGAKKYSETETTKSSFFGLSKSTSINTAFQALDDKITKGFNQTIFGIITGVEKTVAAFGLTSQDVYSKISEYVLSIGKISLKGLNGDEIQKELAAVFGAAADGIAEAVMPGLDDFSKLGEGYFETMVRVASGMDSAQLQLERFNLTAIDYTAIADKQGDVGAEIVRQTILLNSSLGGVKDIMASLDGTAADLADTYGQLLDAANALNSVGITGDALSRSLVRGAQGLDNLQSSLDNYFENYFSDSEKLTAKTLEMGKAFSDLGLVMPASKELLRDMIEGIPKTTEEGQLLLGKVLALTGKFSDLSNMMDKTSLAADSVGSKLRGVFDALSAAMSTFEAALKSVMDSVSAPFDKAIGDNQKLIDELKKKYDVESKAISDAKEAAQYAYNIEKKRREEAKDALEKAFKIADKALQDQIKAETKHEKERVKAYEAASKEIERQQKEEADAYKLSNDLLVDQIDAATDALDKFKRLGDALTRTLKSMRMEGIAVQRFFREDAQRQIAQALKTAQAGGTVDLSGIEDALDEVAKPSENLFSSFVDYQRDFYRTAIDIDALARITGKQLGDAQTELDALKAMKDSADVAHEAAVTAFEKQQEALDLANEIAKEQSASLIESLELQREALASKLEGDIAGLHIDDLDKAFSITMASFDDQMRKLSSDLTAALKPLMTANETLEADKAAALKPYLDLLEQEKLNNIALGANSQALRDLTTALNALKIAQGNIPAGGGGTATNPVTGNTSLAQAQSLYQNNAFAVKSPEAANVQFWADQITANGFSATQTAFNQSVATLNAMVRGWYTNHPQANHNPSADDIAWWLEYVDDHGPEMAKQAFASSVASVTGTPPLSVNSFAVGTNYVPEDMLAQVHEGERIVPRADNAAMMQMLHSGANSDAVAEEMKQLRQEVSYLRAALEATAANTNRTAKALTKWDIDGLPPTTTAE